MQRGHLVPHYQLEVYFPGAGEWIMVEPRGPGAPSGQNLVLYNNLGWSVAGQRRTRPYSRDPRTHVVSLPTTEATGGTR